MLEAAFVGWLVAYLGDGVVRGVSRLLLGSREQRAFASALAAASKAAIAAVMLDVPAGSRDSLESALSECFSVPPPGILDGRMRVRTALAAAIREQIAPLADPGLTPADRSFLEGIGVDPGWLNEEITRVAIRCIEQAGPSFPSLMPLVTQLNADGILELGEAVDAKVDEILAGIERWKQEVPPAQGRDSGSRGGPSRPPYEFPPDAVDRIADALLEIPSISDGETRNAILGMLPNPMRDSIPRSQVPRVQVYHLVRTCPRYAHGLRDLVDTIRSLERGSLPMLQLDSVILEIGQMADGHPSADGIGPGERS